jgi:hypothetical protein
LSKDSRAPPSWRSERPPTLVAALGAASGAADVMRHALLLDWDGAGIIRAPGFTASGFVAEGNPIPVGQLALGPAQLLPYKLATIAALSREMIESGNAETLIADALVRSTGLALDAVFFGNAAASAAQPAGIRNGISTLTASTSTDLYEAFSQDLVQLIDAISAVGGKGPYIVAASAGRITTIQCTIRANRRPISRSWRQTQRVWSAAFSPDGKRIVTRLGTRRRGCGTAKPASRRRAGQRPPGYVVARGVQP